jgi:hypothetical protein
LVIERNKKFSKTIEYVAVVYDLNTITKIKENVIAAIETNWFIVPDVCVKINGNHTFIGIKVTLATLDPKKIVTELIVYNISKGSKTWGFRLNEDFRGEIPYIQDGSIITNGALNNNYDFDIDNGGNVHYLYPFPLNKRQSELRYSYFQTGSDSLRKDYVLVPFIKSNDWNYKIALLKNNKVRVSGFYYLISFGPDNDNVNGFVSFDIDNSSSKVTKIFTDPFNGSKDISSKENSSFYSFKIDNVIPVENSIFVVGHRLSSTRVEREASQMSSPGALNYTMINYEDICVAKINGAGEVEICKTFPFRSKMKTISYVYNIEDIIKQYIFLLDKDNIYVFHNEHPITTKAIEDKEPDTKYKPVWEALGAKNFVVNKINLLDGSCTRKIIEVPEKNFFNPVLQKDYKLAHPIESIIFDKQDKDVFIPFCWGEKLERFLKITLD